MQTINTNNTRDFLALLASEEAYTDLFNQMPDIFVKQANQNYSFFQLEAKDLDTFRIQLNHPVNIGPNAVALKLQLKGVMNTKTGLMVPMKKVLDKHEMYLRGWNSPSIVVTNEDFSEADFRTLQAYANWWEQMEDQGSLWGKNSTRRCWLKAKSNFLFQFRMDLRTNPNTGEVVFGIDDIRLRGCTLLNTFSIQASSIGKPRRLTPSTLSKGEWIEPIRG